MVIKVIVSGLNPKDWFVLIVTPCSLSLLSFYTSWKEIVARHFATDYSPVYSRKFPKFYNNKGNVGDNIAGIVYTVR